MVTTITFGTEAYDAVIKQGFAVGYSYNAFNHAVNAMLNTSSVHGQDMTEEDLAEIRTLFAQAELLDLDFQDAIESIQITGNRGNIDMMLRIVDIIRRRDSEIMQSINKYYPPAVTLH